MEFFYDASRPQKEKSYGRLVTQQRMQLAMAFLNPLRSVINETWLSEGCGNKSKAFGLALKKLMQDAIKGHYPEQYILPEEVVISMGMLRGVDVNDVVLANQQVQLYFTSEENPLTSTTDEVVLVAYSPELGMAGKNDKSAYRNDGFLEIELPVHFLNHSFHLYLYVYSSNRKQYSRSLYLGNFNNDLLLSEKD